MKKIKLYSTLNKKFFKLFIISGVLFTFFGVGFFAPVADASINNQINFQGKLVDNNGLNVSDNTYSVVFSLYNLSSGGSAIWTETDSVTTTGGIFQVALGATTPFPNIDWNNNSLYLGIKVSTDAEMTPRIRFTAVPYAFNAANLDGVVATQSATGFNLQGGTSSSSTVAFTTTGGALTFQPGVAEGLTIQSNGANGLTLDAGGSAGVSLGASQANAVSIGTATNTTTVNGGLTVSSGKTITFNGDAFTDFTGNGLTDSSNALSVLLSSSGNTANTTSNSGLEVSGSGLRLLGGCSTGQVLTYNSATSQWACNSGAALGVNLLQLNGAVLSPGNLTTDFALGGTATASADFVVSGIDSTTPAASISAFTNGGNKNGISLNASTGTIQTFNMNSLTLGGATTGDIILDSGSGVTQIIDNTIQLTGGSPVISSANNALQITPGTNTLTLGTAATGGNIQFFSASNTITNAGNLTLAGTITENGTGTSTFNSATISLAGTNPDITTSGNNYLAIDPAGTGNVIINASGATPLASLDVRSNNGTIATASVSGATAFAGLVINNSGPGDLFTASSSGITRFRVANNGSILFQGDTLSSVGSLRNNSAAVSDSNQSAVINAIGDEGSLVPNSGFESAITANKTTNVASGPVVDGWVATATMSAAVTRIASQSAKGNDSVMFKLNASQSTAVSSVCIPLNLGNSLTYNLNFWANTVTGVSPVVRGYIDGYSSEANCQSNTTPASFTQGSVTNDTTNTWQVYGGATAITTSGTNKWGRVRISVSCPASCVTGNIIYIDGVRLIETSNAVGVDYAEEYPADPNDIPQPGDVVSIVASGSASLAAKTYIPMDQSALGVVSTNPGEVLDDGSITGPKIPVALAGRIPVNVSTLNGPIHVGDYLTSSSIPGVAVKAIHAGQVIGTAMEDDTDSNTSDVTQVTMFVKNTYYNGSSGSATTGLDLFSDGQDASVLLQLLQPASEATNSALTSLSQGQLALGLNLFISTLKKQINASESAVLGVATSSAHEFTVNSSDDSGTATVSANLHVRGNALIEGVLHIADTLFANNFIANGISDFFGNVIFHSNVTFNNTPVFDKDTAGFAVIRKGSDHVVVQFSTPYDQTPIINASITLDPLTPTPSETLVEQQVREAALESTALANIHYIIINRTTKGFTILLDKPVTQDISFSWVALAVNSPVMFQSNGQNIQLPTPTQDMSPSPIDTIIPSTIPTSTMLSPTIDDTPTPIPGG